MALATIDQSEYVTRTREFTEDDYSSLEANCRKILEKSRETKYKGRGNFRIGSQSSRGDYRIDCAKDLQRF